VVDSIARMLLPELIAFYDSEEGQRKYAEWKQAQGRESD